jgi:hypothetical protein
MAYGNDSHDGHGENSMEGGAYGPIPLTHKRFEDYYDIFRLLTDMKHDFKHDFKDVWDRLPLQKNFFQTGLLNEVAFMAKVISRNPDDFYKNLYVRDATKHRDLRPGQTYTDFNKDILNMEYVVCDMALGDRWHVNEITNTCSAKTVKTPNHNKLTRIYSYGNHMDPSPVSGERNKELYGEMGDTHCIDILNTIIAEFFKGVFRFIIIIKGVDPNNTELIESSLIKYKSLIPKISQMIPIPNSMGLICSYKYNFNEYPVQNVDDTGVLSGTDFEIGEIAKDNLLKKLPNTIQGAIAEMFPENGPENVFRKLYLMTFKELGDHIQLHEIKNIRKSYNNTTLNNTIFATRDQILISDTFKQEEPLLFWADSVTGKFTPGRPIPALTDPNKSIILERSNYKSYLFYYSKTHSTNIDFNDDETLLKCIDTKIERYKQYVNDITFKSTPTSRKEELLGVLLRPILPLSNEHTSTQQLGYLVNEKFNKLLELIRTLFSEGKITINVQDNYNNKNIRFIETMLDGMVWGDDVTEIKELNRRTCKALFVLDVAFASLSQYTIINNDRTQFHTYVLDGQHALQSGIEEFVRTSTRINKRTTSKIEIILDSLKKLQKTAYVVYPNYTTYNNRMAATFNILMNSSDNPSFTTYINLNILINSNLHVHPNLTSKTFDPETFITLIETKITEVKTLIKTNDHLLGAYQQDDELREPYPSQPMPSQIDVTMSEAVPQSIEKSTHAVTDTLEDKLQVIDDTLEGTLQEMLKPKAVDKSNTDSSFTANTPKSNSTSMFKRFLDVYAFAFNF